MIMNYSLFLSMRNLFKWIIMNYYQFEIKLIIIYHINFKFVKVKYHYQSRVKFKKKWFIIIFPEY